MKWFLILFLLLLVPLAAAAPGDLQVNISERGNVIDYLSTYWVVQVNGTVLVYNPSDEDLFDVRLFFDLGTLDVEFLSGDGTIDSGSVFFERIPGRGSAQLQYRITGISPEPPTIQGRGVLYTAFTKRVPRVYTEIFGELQKGSLEDSSITGRDGRLISVSFNNPGSLRYTIESLRVIKTPQIDPNQILEVWAIVNSTSPHVVDGGGIFVHDILDTNSPDGLVYWLESVVYLASLDLSDMNTVARFTEQNLTQPVEGFNLTNQTTNATRLLIGPRFFLKKESSRQLVVPSDPVTVTLTLFNLGDTPSDYIIADLLPQGFFSDDAPLRWDGQVPSRGSVSQRYVTFLNDTSVAGLDLFPRATASVRAETIYSNEVAFIRQYVPEERVYVQKSLEFLPGDQVEVTLSVQNLGKNALVDATLIDALEESDVFSQISETPNRRGEWSLPPLSAGDSWQVTYRTERSDSLTKLPVLFGVPNHSVLRSIVLENVVSQAWRFTKTRTIELLGLGVLVLLPLLFLLGRHRGWIH